MLACSKSKGCSGRLVLPLIQRFPRGRCRHARPAVPLTAPINDCHVCLTSSPADAKRYLVRLTIFCAACLVRLLTPPRSCHVSVVPVHGTLVDLVGTGPRISCTPLAWISDGYRLSMRSMSHAYFLSSCSAVYGAGVETLRVVHSPVLPPFYVLISASRGMRSLRQ